jgi:phenylacetate-CoA ligase
MVSFFQFPTRSDAFSALPFNIIRPEDKPAFNLLMEIIFLETGPRMARAQWQKAQLNNLLNHAKQRSKFWRERIDARKVSASSLQKLPVLTRSDVNRQIKEEGSLLSVKDQIEILSRTTSGSTGEPVKFHATSANAVFNEIRSFAQYLIENRDLSLNRCRLLYDPLKPVLSFAEEKTFAGALNRIFQTGKNAELHYFDVDYDQIIRKLTTYRAHYFVCLPQFLESIASLKGLDIFKKIDTKLIITYGQATSSAVINGLAQRGIEHTSSYSCEEIGLIASECREEKGYFHVAESNAILEPGDMRIDIAGEECRNILVTGLHSYATPFIRYDLGDLGQIKSRCPCGHEGQVISSLHGRVASTLKLNDGRRRPFFISANQLGEIIKYEDLRVRQTSNDTVTVDIVAPEPQPEIRDKLQKFLGDICGQQFRVQIKFCAKIDWGSVRKRHLFLCEAS